MRTLLAVGIVVLAIACASLYAGRVAVHSFSHSVALMQKVAA